MRYVKGSIIGDGEIVYVPPVLVIHGCKTPRSYPWRRFSAGTMWECAECNQIWVFTESSMHASRWCRHHHRNKKAELIEEAERKNIWGRDDLLPYVPTSNFLGVEITDNEEEDVNKMMLALEESLSKVKAPPDQRTEAIKEFMREGLKRRRKAMKESEGKAID